MTDAFGRTYSTRQTSGGTDIYDLLNGGGGTGGGASWSTGWVNTDGVTAVANGATLNFTHNLGTTDLTFNVYWSPNSSGTDSVMVNNAEIGSASTDALGLQIQSLTTTSVTIQLSNFGFIELLSNGTRSGHPDFNDGYIKVVASSGGGTSGGGTSGGGASVTTDTVAPTDPSDGDLWFNETTGELYVYVDTVSGWVQTNGGSGSSGVSLSYTATPSSLDLQSTTEIDIFNETVSLSGTRSIQFKISYSAGGGTTNEWRLYVDNVELDVSWLALAPAYSGIVTLLAVSSSLSNNAVVRVTNKVNSGNVTKTLIGQAKLIIT